MFLIKRNIVMIFFPCKQGKNDKKHSHTKVKLQYIMRRAWFERRLARLQNKAIKHLVNFN